MNEREVARELLRELLDGALANRNGQTAAQPQVPAPPVAAVLRPSTWSGPPVPGEVVGDAAALAAPTAENVTLAGDEDLDRFVRALAARCEDPAERAAIRDGRRRFTLAAAAATGAAHGATLRVERGAVTERTVERAAKAGARLVLAPGAVLTPLAREKARALGIEIEREPRC